MNIAIDIDEFSIENVFFQEPVKNTVMDDSNFIRALYSTDLLVLNGIFIKITLKTTAVERYFNKFKCSFDIAANRDEISKIVMLESMILQRAGLDGKRSCNKIHEQLASGNIKLFTDNGETRKEDTFILKMSGIWETETDYGITYKFMDVVEN